MGSWEGQVSWRMGSAGVNARSSLMYLCERLQRKQWLYNHYKLPREASIECEVDDLLDGLGCTTVPYRCCIALSGCELTQDDVSFVARESGVCTTIEHPTFLDMEKLRRLIGNQLQFELNKGISVIRASVELPMVWQRGAPTAPAAEPDPKGLALIGRLAESAAACCRVASYPPPKVLGGFYETDHFLARETFEGWTEFGATTRQRATMLTFPMGPFGESIATLPSPWEIGTRVQIGASELDTIRALASPSAKHRIAVSRFSSALARRNDSDMLLDLVIAIENALRRPGDRELSHLSNPERLGLIAVATLASTRGGCTQQEVRGIYDAIANMYRRRNKLAHGADDAEPPTEDEILLVRELLLASAAEQANNSWPPLVDRLLSSMVTKR